MLDLRLTDESRAVFNQKSKIANQKSAKHLDDFLHRRDEAVNFRLRVVEGEGGAGGGGHAEVLHDGLRAVMACAYGDALLVEYRADIVRVHLVNHKREHARLLARVADDADALDRRDFFGGVAQKLVRARGDLLDRVYSAERVRDVADADELRSLVQERVELVQEEFARVVHRDDSQARALLFTEHLPGDEVRVVLHLGDNYLVALA